MASRLLVLGATGATGRLVVARAIELGHTVTVLVRSPDRLEVSPDRVRVITGTLPDDGAALVAAVRGQDAVISALGVGRSFTPNDLMARSIPLIVQVMESEGPRRLVFTSAFGVGSTWADTPLLPRIFIRTLLRKVYADKAAGEHAITHSMLDWTLVHPVGLTNAARGGRYRVGEHLDLRGFPTIPRADLADFLLTQVDDRSFIGRRVLVAS